VAVVLLDTEALSVLAAPKERGASARRAQAVLHAALLRKARVCTSAAVLVEAYRGRFRSAAVDRVLNQGVEVLHVDQGSARIASRLLDAAALDSCSAVDSILVATGIRLGGALILTSDPDDLTRLSMGHPAVEVQALR
jgi:predicted nucleic acid-binding protein